MLQTYGAETKFYSVNTIFGISMREITSICRDDNGFMWASSKTGVLRLTEGDSRIYQLPYITADVITVKLVYRTPSLYAYTNNGQVFLYDELSDKFKFLADFKKLFKRNYLVVNDMSIDSNGDLLVSSTNGLYRYNKKSISYTRTPLTNIEFFDKDRIFCLFDKGSIGLLNLRTSKVSKLFADNEVAGFTISRLYFDKSSGKLWIGTISEGLFCYNIKTRKLTEVLSGTFPKQPVLAIEKNFDKSLFIGIDGQGIWHLSEDGTQILDIFRENVDNPLSLPGDGVYDIFLENNKRVWVATYTGGLSFFDQQSPLVNQITHRINTPNSLSNNCVNKVIEDKKGNMWFATNNGISRWEPSINRWTSFYQNKQEQAKVFLALEEDNSGNIWAGTYSSGVYVIDGVTGRELMHFLHGWQDTNFSGRFIFDIFKDSDGDIWIGGVNSNVIWYQSSLKNFKIFGPQPVRTIKELSPGVILLACTYGLISIDKESGKLNFLILGVTTQDIYVDGKVIWLGTSGDGLLKYDVEKRTTEKFTTDNGLLSNYINSIECVNGFFWIGTESGLCRFDPKTGKVLTFSSIFALSNTSFNVNSKTKLRNGDMAFGTSNGAVVFSPEKLYQPHFKGNIFFNDLKISGRSIRENSNLLDRIPVNKLEKIRLKYNQNTLELELVPTGVSSRGSKFSWKMSGIDKDWNQPSNRKVVTYTNMPSGSFDLHIRMYDSSISQLIDERVLHIRIVPPFWASWWFQMIIFVLIAAIVYFSLKYYANYLKGIHTEDKIRFFTSTAHDIRTSLTLITAPIEELSKEQNLSEKGKYYLNLASEQSGRLSFVATQLLDLQKVDIGKGQIFLIMVDVVLLVKRRILMFEAAIQKKNLKINFSSSTDSYQTAMDELKIEKVVDNLISNAVKYSPVGAYIDISLSCFPNEWILEVKDYGIGISVKEQKKLFREFYRGDNSINSKVVGSGIGLMLVKNYVEMHNGEVSLESRENVGASFRIVIPHKIVKEVALAVNDNVRNISGLSEVVIDDIAFDNDVSEVIPDKKMNILVVEDNNDLQSFLKISFSSDYNVLIANDGSKAWEIIQKQMPDLVVSDIMMPNMDGFELCRLIKSTFETAHIPVVLLTAISDRTNQLEGLKLGADDYITKPFDMLMLKQRIVSIIRNRNAVKEKVLQLFSKPETDVPILVNEHNDHFVKKALEIVQMNIANCDFGKDEFASAINVSPSLLYKKIKSLTGLSPVDFIKVTRLDYSIELLKSHKHTVTEVSELCGFSSVGYFSTVFKKHFGKSPTEIV